MKKKAAELQEIYSRTVPGREAENVPFPETMRSELQSMLRDEFNITQLYCHQGEMFEKACDGKNVVITTSTASGKTLSFLLPVLQKLIEDEQARAIFIYPMNALVNDQYITINRALKYLRDKFEIKITASKYIGGLSPDQREDMLFRSRILLTNPDMLHVHLIPEHDKRPSQKVLINLRYIVIDEMHTYKAAFGANVANLFVRMKRICDKLEAFPQFLCSTATISNPVSLAESLCWGNFELINKDGSAAPEKTYHFIEKGDEKDATDNAARTLTVNQIVSSHKVITFAPSRKETEVIAMSIQKDVEGLGQNPEIVTPYHAGLMPDERNKIENALKNGQKTAIISTNALELGIDIGSLDSCVIMGFPKTKAAFWQRSGRAGRRGRKSDTFLILDNEAFCGYLRKHPEYLFESENEPAIIYKRNRYIQRNHIVAAAREMPLSADDSELFPDMNEICAELIDENVLRVDKHGIVLGDEGYKYKSFSLRSADGDKYELTVHIEGTDKSDVIAELDKGHAIREFFIGAIYIHNGELFSVKRFEVKQLFAEAERIDYSPYYTKAVVQKEVSVTEEPESVKAVGKATVYYGDVHVREEVCEYLKVSFDTGRIVGRQRIPVLSREFDTKGLWFVIPAAKFRALEKLLEPLDVSAGEILFNSIMRAGMVVCNTTDDDVAFSDKELFCIYDVYDGGLGFSEALFNKAEEIVAKVNELLDTCECGDGCIACTGTPDVTKEMVRAVLDAVLSGTKQIEIPEETEHTGKFDPRKMTKEYASFMETVKANEPAEIADIFEKFYLLDCPEDRYDGRKIYTVHLKSIVIGQEACVKDTIRKYVNIPDDAEIEVDEDEFELC